MKKRSLCVLPVICCLLPVFLYGCATVKEAAKGFAGVSTKVLEEGRKDGLRESFPMGYSDCYARVKDILEEKFKMKSVEADQETEVQSYIYAEDQQKNMIAIYLSETDTTPVGIFFSRGVDGNTLVEVSSPSTYAKELIAARIFGGIKAALKPAAQERKADAV